jgi:UDP-glucose 4-epimerase
MPTPALEQAYRGRRVLVTGGAGFIGSHLVESLVAAGATVRVIDDLSQGREANLAGVRDRVELIVASILDREAMARAAAGASVVFHQAALTSVPGSVEHPRLYLDVNVGGTLEVLEAARAAGVDRVVYAGSSSAYGEQPHSPKVETMEPQPLSPYAASKCAGEGLLRAYCACYGLRGVTLRYFNVFGPRQRPDSPYAAVIPLFIDALLDGRRPLVHGDGTQTRDFTHVASVVQANLRAGTVEPAPTGEVVNVACGRGVSLLELLDALGRALDVAPVCDFGPPRVGDIKHSVADVTRARDRLGFDPESGVSFEQGLAHTVAWFRAERE